MKIQVLGAKLNEIIRKHKLFLGDKNSKTVLQGVNVKLENGKITLCTLDAFQMIISEFKIENEENFDITVKLPKMKYDKKLSVDIDITPEGISLSQNGIVENLEVIKEEYVKYERMYPTEHKYQIAVDPKKLIRALEAMKNDGVVLLQFNEKYQPIEVVSVEDYSIVLPLRIDERMKDNFKTRH